MVRHRSNPDYQAGDRSQKVYLEICSPKSAAFYERHGFELEKTI